MLSEIRSSDPLLRATACIVTATIAYRDEVERAEKRALPFYAAAVLAGLIGLSMVRKSYRVFRKTRPA